MGFNIGKFISGAVNRSVKSIAPGVLQAGQGLVAQGQAGFQAATNGLMSNLPAAALTSMRNGLDAFNKKGFDSALALHIGAGNLPGTPGLSPTGQAAAAIAAGMGDLPPDNRASITGELIAHPEGRLGVEHWHGLHLFRRRWLPAWIAAALATVGGVAYFVMGGEKMKKAA